jgi:hypothetical protein
MSHIPRGNAQHYLLEVSIQQAGLNTVQVSAELPLAEVQHTVMYHLQPEQQMSNLAKQHVHYDSMSSAQGAQSRACCLMRREGAAGWSRQPCGHS